MEEGTEGTKERRERRRRRGRRRKKRIIINIENFDEDRSIHHKIIIIIKIKLLSSSFVLFLLRLYSCT